ncbi:MAG: mammalian cell entry protein, partial [Zoogloea sp.]|nr:mammalian cell entry protein [Zoogloea sp.]
WNRDPPLIPTQRGSLEELQTTLLRIIGRLDKLPLEAIGRDTSKAIAGLGRTIDEAEQLVRRLDGLTSGDVRETVVEARSAITETRAAIADARKLLATDAPLQQDMRASLQELSRAAQALRHLADTLDRHPEALLRGKPEEKP